MDMEGLCVLQPWLIASVILIFHQWAHIDGGPSSHEVKPFSSFYCLITNHTGRHGLIIGNKCWPIGKENYQT